MKSRVLLSRILFVLYLAAIAFLCLTSSNSLPQLKTSFLGLPTDKVAHFLMFLPFPILFYLSSEWKADKFWKALLYTLLIFVVGCGVAAGTEYLQKLTPTRVADKADFMADAIALGCSSLLVFIVLVSRKK